MKLLLASDIHNDLNAASRIVQVSRHADAVVLAGDFCVMRQGLARVIEELRPIDRPAILVAGNAESVEELRAACQLWPAARVLDGQSTEVAGVQFFGLGGAVPETPFGPWSYDLTEEQAAELLADFPHSAVLVSHSPPKGIADRSSSGQSLGSQAVRDLIQRGTPRLVVCGHIHESWGQRQQVGKTWVINAGPQATLWDLAAARPVTGF